MNPMPGKQPSVNGIARVNSPAARPYQGFNDLALAKTEDPHLKWSTYLRSNPEFVQHQMCWYPAYDCFHYLGSAKLRPAG
jgi:hypothetical protein